MPDATLIAFPRRPEDRLRLALHRLDEALAAQREAVAGWRAEIGALAGATAGLGANLGGFRGDLSRVAETVGAARAQALRLNRRAEAMLARANR